MHCLLLLLLVSPVQSRSMDTSLRVCAGRLLLRAFHTCFRVLSFAELNYHIHHDEDARVYLNGTLVESFKGYTSDYEDLPASKATLEALREGVNVMAIHCKQTTGGQYIDVGLVDISMAP